MDGDEVAPLISAPMRATSSVLPGSGIATSSSAPPCKQVPLPITSEVQVLVHRWSPLRRGISPPPVPGTHSQLQVHSQPICFFGGSPEPVTSTVMSPGFLATVSPGTASCAPCIAGTSPAARAVSPIGSSVRTNGWLPSSVHHVVDCRAAPHTSIPISVTGSGDTRSAVRSPTPTAWPLLPWVCTLDAAPATFRSQSPHSPAPTSRRLAKRLQELREAKHIAAVQYAISNERIAARQDSLRRETIQALQSTPRGLAEALKWWPSPRAADSRVARSGQVLLLANQTVTPPKISVPFESRLTPTSLAAAGIPLHTDSQFNSYSIQVASVAGAPHRRSGDVVAGNLSPLQLHGSDSRSAQEELSEAANARHALPDGPLLLPYATQSQNADSHPTTATASVRAPMQCAEQDLDTAPNCAKAARLAFAVEQGTHSGPSRPSVNSFIDCDSPRPEPLAEVSSVHEGRLAEEARHSARHPSQSRKGLPPTSSLIALPTSYDLAAHQTLALGTKRPVLPRASSPPPRAHGPDKRLMTNSVHTSHPALEQQSAPSSLQDTLSRCAQALSPRLSELRSLQRPSGIVNSILETTAILLGTADIRWQSVRKVLQSNILERLRDFNLEEVTLGQCRRVHNLLLTPGFDEESIRTEFPAVLPLAVWCRAIGAHLARTGFGGSIEADSFSSNTVSHLRISTSDDEPPEFPVLQELQEPQPQPEPMEAEQSLTREAPAENLVKSDCLVITPDLTKLSAAEKREVLELGVSRPGISGIVFHGVTDCSRLDIPRLVHLDVGEVLVYPEPGSKPPVGQGLNKRATVTMYMCFPPNGRGHLKDARSQERYCQKIKRMTEEKGATFVDYDYNAGIWTFQVEHF